MSAPSPLKLALEAVERLGTCGPGVPHGALPDRAAGPSCHACRLWPDLCVWPHGHPLRRTAAGTDPRPPVS